MKKKSSLLDGKGWWLGNAYFMKWTAEDVFGVVKYHPIPCVFAASLLLFMGVEYTLRMIPASSPPFDLGFIVTVPLNRLLAARPALNTLFAGLNTVSYSHHRSNLHGLFIFNAALVFDRSPKNTLHIFE